MLLCLIKKLYRDRVVPGLLLLLLSVSNKYHCLLDILGFLSHALTLDIGLSRRISHGDIGLKVYIVDTFEIQLFMSNSVVI